MIVSRIINGIEIDVEINESNTLYFDDCQTADLQSYDVESIKDFLFSRTYEYAPYSVIWELTNKCNLNCQFCYINYAGAQKCAFPSLAECKAVIDGLVSAGMLFCTLTGGECLLHPDFPNIYSYLKQKGVLVSVFTNASLLNTSHLALFSEYPPYKMEVSIYGISEQGFEEVTKSKGSICTAVLDNILLLQSMGIQVICKTPLNTLTQKETPQIKAWCQDHKVPFYNSPELLDSYSGESMDRFLVSNQILNEYETRNFQELAKKTGCEFGYKNAFSCPGGKTIAFISYDMHIHPCSSAFGIQALSVPIREHGLCAATETLSSIIREHRGKRLHSCQGCNYHDVCSRCIVDEYKPNAKRNDYCRHFQAAIGKYNKGE